MHLGFRAHFVAKRQSRNYERGAELEKVGRGVNVKKEFGPNPG